MKYIMLIHADEDGAGPATPEEAASMTTAVDEFDLGLEAEGKNIGSVRLQPSSDARVVRVRGGRALVTDGPFAETKEQLGGVWLIEADDIEEATEIATRLPTATFCTIEVRPVLGLDIK